MVQSIRVPIAARAQVAVTRPHENQITNPTIEAPIKSSPIKRTISTGKVLK